MRPLLLGLALALTTLLTPALARAQACCAGVSAITPGRLEPHEKVLVGLQLRAAHHYGRFDSKAHYRDLPEGSSEFDLEQDLLGAVRWLRRGQTSLQLPVLQSWRSARGTGAEFGSGLGDLSVGARYDLVLNREYRAVPGLALLAGVTLPTGRAAEDAEQPLLSDATGTGATQLSLGLSLERSLGEVMVSLTGVGAKRLPRQVQGLESELAMHYLLQLGVAYGVTRTAAIAALLSYSFEGDASVAGRATRDSGRRQLRAALAYSTPLVQHWRLQAALSAEPPLTGLGQNQSASLGGTLGVLWGWY